MSMWRRTTTPMMIDTLASLYREGRLSLTPDYQRERVWSTSLQQRLIVCILKGQDLNKIFLHQKMGLGKQKNIAVYDVVDGKQRLTTIFDFLEEKFAITRVTSSTSPIVAKDLMIDGSSVAGFRYSQLPDDLKGRFNAYPVDATVIETDDQDRIVDQFVDLQRGRPLTPQATREAYPSALNSAVRKLESHPFLLSLRYGRSVKGGAARLVLARLFAYELANRIVDVMSDDITRLYLQSTMKLLTEQQVFEAASSVKAVLDSSHQALTGVRPAINSSFASGFYWLIRQLRVDGINIPQQRKAIHSWYEDFYGRYIQPDLKGWSHHREWRSVVEADFGIMYADIQPHLPGYTSARKAQRSLDEHASQLGQGAR